jgi:predicted enzyme related to lactoylglutathione lyase
MARATRFASAADDSDTAARLDERALAWRVQRGFDETSYRVAPTKRATDRGVVLANEISAGGPVVDTVSVHRLEDAIALVCEAGGSTASEIRTIPEVGRFVYVFDAEGNLLGLVEEDPAQAALAARPGPRIV